ncbi:MAG: tetratricopeptide repeat protein [Psychrilyobacter sp.]|nr:tetratricopeptide repeat protein [Psychrilyobacter sp.]
MKKKILLISLFMAVSSFTMASDRDDMKYIDKLYGAKEYKMATEELKTFVEKYPESSYQKSALSRLSKTLFLEKEYKESANYYIKYLNNNNLEVEEKNEAHYYRARSFTSLKDYNGAKKEINTIGKDSPKRVEAVYYLGKSYYDNGNYVEAQNTFKLLINKPTRAADALLYISLATYNNREYLDSVTYLDEYLKENSEARNLELANYMYGMNQYKLGNNDKAIEKFVKVETDYPKSKYIADVRLGLLEVYLVMENMPKVEEYYLKIEKTKNADKVNTILGKYYLDKKDYTKSLSYYKLVKTSKDLKVTYGLGFTMLKVGEMKKDTEGAKLVEDSKKEFKKLVGTSYNSQGIYYTALIDFRAKKYSEVIEDLKTYDESKMNKEYKNNIDIFLGKSYFNEKNYKKSRVYYRNVYNRSHSKKDLYQLILVNSRLGDTINAQKRFLEYKSNFSTDLEYRQKIYLLTGNTYYKANDLKNAKATYKEYLKSHDDHKISENFITILIVEGSFGELVSYLTPQPKIAENRYLMGIGFLGLTQYDKAIKEFKSVVIGTDATEIQKEKANYNLIKSNFVSRNYLETIKTANQYLGVVSYTKHTYDVIDFKGLANFRLEKYSEARKIFTKLGENEKYKEYSRFQIAETYYNESKYDTSYKEYINIYSSNKKGEYSMRSLYWAINILYLQEKYQEVVDKSKEFTIEYSKSSYLNDVNFYRGDSYSKLDDMDSAAKTYITIYNGSSDAAIKDKAARELTTIYYNSDNFTKAELWKDKISASNEKIYFSALIYEKQGKKDLAIGEYKKLIKTSDYGSKSNFNLASAYYKEKKYDEAKRYYENMLSLENGANKDLATYQIGQIYMIKKDYSKALRNFMKIELVYKESDYREASKLKIASAYEGQKEEAKAKKTYEEFYKSYPKSKYRGVVLEKLVVIYINENKIEEGRKYYTELVKLNSGVADNYNEYFIKKKGE